MEKLKNLIKKVLTKEVIFYIIFGVFTTLVNISTYYVLHTLFNVEENLSNNIAILLAVLFAYFTNRKLVFNSQAKGAKEKLIEFGKFMLGRLFTMILESAGFYLLFNILSITMFNGLISKAAITVIIIILNFFISKFFAFKKAN